jgi:hypothetical protein
LPLHARALDLATPAHRQIGLSIKPIDPLVAYAVDSGGDGEERKSFEGNAGVRIT